MKIQFKDLNYQNDAINSIVRVFEGHHIRQSNFTISGHSGQQNLITEHGTANRIVYNPERMLSNVHQIQIDNQLPLSDKLASPFPQFNIEMETGTGKTFVYLKSILELNETYGFTKFIIVVPSVAIKEGVFKSLEITEDYFKSTMNGIVYRSFMYDSSKLEHVDTFARNDTIEIMVINIQSFSKRKKNDDNMNIIYREDIDALNGIAPIDLISETNPIVFIDEPQSVDNTPNAQAAIEALNPSTVFRFSATHKQKFPLLYKLGPVEAYREQLVKQIEVAGFSEDIDPNEAYFKLISTKANKKSVTATVEMNVKNKDGVELKQVVLKQNDDLYNKSKRLPAYEGLGFVRGISAETENEYIELSGGKQLYRLSETQQEDQLMKRAQIRMTIQEHLDKELKLNPKGIKVLSLFFIDQVDKYRQYDKENKPLKGEYAQIFEEEYRQIIQKEKYGQLRDRQVPVEEVHDGYFAIDGKKKFKNSFKGNSADDESTYKIIMQDKEDLLTLYDKVKGKTEKAHKLRFIFSHSALKEGWDNPNVFQICTLIETQGEISKRQKIGRGLRIAVNQNGERVPGFETNTLTVMANESYNDFAAGLQKEYEDEGVRFGVFEENIFSSLVINADSPDGYKQALGLDKSKDLVNYLKAEGYLDKHHKGTEILAKAIRDKTFTIPESISNLAPNMLAKVTEAIENRFNIEKVEIKDRKKRVTVKLNKQALTGPFLELWNRIKARTTYSIEFNTERFIQTVSERLSEEIIINRRRLAYTRAKLETESSGISAIEEEHTDYTSFEKRYEEVPDILSFLQNETHLTRQTLIKILKQSDTLRDFKRNPQEYMTSIARIINSEKRIMMVDGIQYTRIDESYDQSLFELAEIEQYTDNTVESSNDRYPYNYVVVDSEIEREFALECERDDNVKYYIKMPAQFKIDTPLGTYNPDWAILLESNGEDRLYFVVETKGSNDPHDLRHIENAKIRCGRKHFDAVDTGITFKLATEIRDVY